VVLNSISDDEIAESAVTNFENLKKQDAISLLEKQVTTNNGKEITYYFFEIESRQRRSV
jgi:hypothetical protein